MADRMRTQLLRDTVTAVPRFALEVAKETEVVGGQRITTVVFPEDVETIEMETEIDAVLNRLFRNVYGFDPEEGC